MRTIKLFISLAMFLAGVSIFSPQAQATGWTIDTQNPNYTCTAGAGNTPFTSLNCTSTAGHCAAVGDLVVIEVNYYQSPSAQTVTASNANAFTWTTRVDTATALLNYRSVIFDAISTTSTCDSFTVTFSGAVIFTIMTVSQARPSGGTAAFDATCSPTPSCWTTTSQADPQVASSVTTTVAGDLIIATWACANGNIGAWTPPGSGYTKINSSGSNAWTAEYSVVGAAGSYAATQGNSGTSCNTATSVINVVPVAYKIVASGSPPAHSRIIKIGNVPKSKTLLAKLPARRRSFFFEHTELMPSLLVC